MKARVSKKRRVLTQWYVRYRGHLGWSKWQECGVCDAKVHADRDPARQYKLEQIYVEDQ